jgi:hypothetical protein
MRCDCCDADLNDSEATAKFAESGNYVNMCTECRSFLPRDIRILLRPDLEYQTKNGKKAKEDDDQEWENHE